MDTKGAPDRAAGLTFRQTLLGFSLLVLGKLGLSTKPCTALARFNSASVRTLQNALPFVLG